jgi:HAD superfamily hydrolase (TIGR01509 family)
MKCKGIIFDFNGVLLWDISWHREAWKQLAEKFGKESFTEEEWKHFEGVPTGDLVPKLLGRNVTEDELATDVRKKDALYREIAEAKETGHNLSPGAAPLLDELAKRNIPRAIATSSSPGDMDYFIKTYDLGRWFDPLSVVCTDGSFPGKPAPDIYRIAAERIGVAIGQCIVIEDSLSGVVAAKNAGAGTVIGLGTAARHQELLAAGADSAIQTLGDVRVQDLL